MLARCLSFCQHGGFGLECGTVEENCPLQKGIVSEPISRDLAKTCTRFLALSKPQSNKLWCLTHPAQFVLQIRMIPENFHLVYICKRSNLHLADNKIAAKTNKIKIKNPVLH